MSSASTPPAVAPVSLAAPPALVITRTIHASREHVFAAWTDARQLAQWFSPTADFTIEATADPRPGGSYRIAMHHPSGKTHIVGGTYREVHPPQRLVFTWAWEQGNSAETTLVTIDLRSTGSATELTMTHELLPTEDSRQQHEHGWNGCLNRLTLLLDPNAPPMPDPPPMAS